MFLFIIKPTKLKSCLLVCGQVSSVSSYIYFYFHTYIILELDNIDFKTAQTNADLIFLYPVQKRLAVPH